MLGTAAELSAQSASWTPVNAVPMSPLMLGGLAALFLGTGVYLLSRSRKGTQRMLTGLLLAAGMIGFVQQAKALSTPPDVVITTPSGTADLPPEATSTIQNSDGNVAVKLTIDPDGCASVSTDCNVLQPGETCSVTVAMCGGPA